MASRQQSPAEKIANHNKKQIDLEYLGLHGQRKLYWNLDTDSYYQEALSRDEGVISKHDALVVRSGERTARSARDKFIVQESGSETEIAWGEYNTPYTDHDFEKVYSRMKEFLKGKDLFIQDGYAGASPDHQISVRIITTKA